MSGEFSHGGSSGGSARDRQFQFLQDMGLFAESADISSTPSSMQPATQVIYGSGIHLYAGEVVTNIAAVVATAGGGTAPSNCKLGLWSSAATPVCLALTAELIPAGVTDAGLTSLGVKWWPLTGAYTVPSDGLYYASMWLNGTFGTTQIKLAGTNLSSAFATLTTSGTAVAFTKRPYTGLKTAATTVTVADTGTYGTASGFGFWMGVS